MSRMLTLATLALIGCGQQDAEFDPLHPTGSSTIATSASRGVAAVVNVDDDSVSILDLDTDAVDTFDLGEQPTRIARIRDHFLVTLRGERAVVLVAPDGTEVRRASTGPEPWGVVADEAGRRAFVAVSGGNEVIELDPKLNTTRSWHVPDQPRWLALHPNGQVLFVASNREGRVTRIDLESGKTADIELPGGVRPHRDGPIVLTPRLTGDPTVTPDGGTLVLPGLLVDNHSEVIGGDEDVGEGSGYNGSGDQGIERFNPVLFHFPLTEQGQVDEDEDETFPILLAARSRRHREVRSYPTSATASPNGHDILVTLEASDVVLVVALNRFQNDRGRGGFGGGRFDRNGFTFAPPEAGGMVARPQALVYTRRGPKGVAFRSDGSAVVHEWLQGSVSNVNYREAEDQVLRASRDGQARRELGVGYGPQLFESKLSSEVYKGRDMFFSATDERMAGLGGGISCSTCHFEGRDDGLTWTFTIGDRQTPSLAGRVSQTAPVTWTEDVDSVATEAQLTTSLRMGGQGLNDGVAARVEAFIDSTPHPDVGGSLLDAAAVERGRAVFERPDVGCATCHNGERYTDNKFHDLYGLRGVNTPSLTAVAATGPYLHDGSAATLRQVIDQASENGMGNTAHLSDAERDDLETFLLSL